MRNLRLALSPMVVAAGILALSGASVAQVVVVTGTACPVPKASNEKITEDQARNLAQQYADKNMAGFKVVRPGGYGGGYSTLCYRKDPATGKLDSFYSVEYLIDATNAGGATRSLRVDQYGHVAEFTGTGAALVK